MTKQMCYSQTLVKAFIANMLFFGGMVCLLAIWGNGVDAFSPVPTLTTTTTTTRATSSRSRNVELVRMRGGLFGMDGLFGGNKKKTDDNDPSVPKLLFDIPVESLKIGGLRFALGLYLIGEQGTPTKGSWQAQQAADDKLDMFYMKENNCAMFEVSLADKLISVNRYGQPTLPYLLQESVILHGLLDELTELAFNNDIEPQNRLLALSSPDEKPNVIEKARETLPARKVE